MATLECHVIGRECADVMQTKKEEQVESNFFILSKKKVRLDSQGEARGLGGAFRVPRCHMWLHTRHPEEGGKSEVGQKEK